MNTRLQTLRIIFIPLYLCFFNVLSAQLPACDQIPYIKCDSTYQLTSEGPGNLLLQDTFGDTYYGPETYFRFKAEYSDELLLTANNIYDYQRAVIVLQDSALTPCFDLLAGTQALLSFSNDPVRTISLGQVEAGHTYYLILDRNADDLLQFGLRLHCPAACPYPRQLKTTAIGDYHARLGWQNNAWTDDWELEIAPFDSAFTGTPTYSGQGNFVEAAALQPLKRYHWRVRDLCSGNTMSEWSPAHTFATGPDCSNVTSLVCGQNSSFAFPGGPELLTNCEAPNQFRFKGPEIYATYTPAYDGHYFVSIQGTVGFNQMNSMRTGLDQDCNMSDWTCLGSAGSSGPVFLQLGFLKGDSTYLFAFEFDDQSDHSGQTIDIGLYCPAYCLIPDSIYTTNVTSSTATIGWKAQPNQTQWEIELSTYTPGGIGVFNYFSNTNSYQLNNLTRGILYRWRVRGICGTELSAWSNLGEFINPPDCDAFPLLECNDAVDVSFSGGYGYLVNGANCVYGDIRGFEQVLRFNIGQGGGSRYFFRPENKAVFLRKQYFNEDCLLGIWNCLSDSLYGDLYRLRGLDSGYYEILIKQGFYAAADTVHFEFLCDVPCTAATAPYTDIHIGSNGYDYVPKWSSYQGPWTYELEFRDEQGLVQTTPILGSGQLDLENVFSLTSGAFYEWRVRKLCQGATVFTDWTEWTRFQVVIDCNDAVALPCGQNEIFASTSQPVVVYDECSTVSHWGSTKLYRISIQTSGTYSLDITGANGQPLQYALSDEGNCHVPVTACMLTSVDTNFTFGTLLAGSSYLLKVTSLDSLAAVQTFTFHCPCPSLTAAIGTLFPDSTAHLSFQYVANTTYEIELLPIEVPFSGIPNYTSTVNSPVYSGFDPGKEYHFRFRTSCSNGQWSGVFELNHAFSCNSTPVLPCDSTIQLHIGTGPGLLDNVFGGPYLPGQERYLRFKPLATGNYVLSIQHLGGSSNVKVGLFDACVAGGSSSYLPVNINSNTSIPLIVGHTYTLVFDNFNLLSGTYAVSVDCIPVPPANDNAFDYAPWGLLIADSVAINAPCQTFTNRNASADMLDPNPSLPPGNWFDGPEKTVWFYFEAPPGGTVQVNVTSDSMDPQVAIVRFDSVGFFGYNALATGEDLPGSSNASLIYTGLNPGQRYLLMVDGVNGSSGDFCLEILDEPTLTSTTGVCQTFPQVPSTGTLPGDWINLYAGDGAHINGPLLAAIQTVDNLGAITISSEIHPDAPVLPNGQKILPRYWNIEPEFQPGNPVKLRLFFTENDLEIFNLTPPVDSITVPQLGITHYDGGGQDCDPENNVLGGTSIPVSNATYAFVGQNGIFYLETTVTQFSEFGAALDLSSKTTTPDALPVVNIYPIPTSDAIFLDFLALENETLQVQIQDLTGAVRYQDSWDINAGRSVKSIQLGELPSGVYLLTLRNASGKSRTAGD